MNTLAHWIERVFDLLCTIIHTSVTLARGAPHLALAEQRSPL